MKKLFISLLTVAATLNVMATSSVTVHILDNEGWESDMYLTESTEGTLTAEVEPGNSIALYAIYNSKKCEQLRLETLGELPIGFKIQATTATMTVTDASGDPLYMKTLADGTITELAKDAVINITIASDKVNTWVEDMYQLCAAPAPTAYTRDVTANQWGTICYPAAITEVQGGVLYELTGATETQVFAEEVDLSGDNTTVAGQPYVFKANADATQLVMPYTAGTEAMNPVYAKGLVGTFFGLEEGVPAGAYGILNNVVVEIAAGNPLLANRAYIDLEDLKVAPGAPVRGRAIFMIQNATTGLEGATVNGLQNGTYMVNGQLVIVKDGKTFNVLGL